MRSKLGVMLREGLAEGAQHRTEGPVPERHAPAISDPSFWRLVMYTSIYLAFTTWGLWSLALSLVSTT